MNYTITLFLAFILNAMCMAQAPAYAREIVNTLSSPEFKGRGYTANGHVLAAEYIMKQYQNLGLLSFGNSYYQEFNISANTFPGQMKCIVNGVDLAAGRDFVVDPASCSIKGTYPVLVVNEADLLDEKVLGRTLRNVAGKVILIDERNFKAADKAQQKLADDIKLNFKYNPLFSNKATILLTHDKLTWGISSVQQNKASVTMNGNDEISGRSTVDFDIDAGMADVRTRNVVGYIRGVQKPDSFLVVTAHYDHLGQMGKEVIFPGANDNASGVAMLLSLAKHFASSPPQYSMVFIALSAEETGLQGAGYFVSNPLIDLKKIRFLVNFDLAGTGEEGIKVVNGSVYKDNFDLLKKINDEKLYLKSVQSRGAACNSDHCIFYEQGVPCFYIYTLGGIQAYHDIYDRAETLPLTEFNDYTQLMIDFLGSL